MSRWWGEPWPSEHLRAPVCEDDALRVPVPVGEPCLWCEEAIKSGDRGEETAFVDRMSVLRIGQFHIECAMRQALGGPAHLLGCCLCCGGDQDPDLGMSPREAALWVWEWVQENGVLRA